VSALGQVIALHLRSNLKRGVEFIDSDATTTAAEGGEEEDTQVNTISLKGIRSNILYCVIPRRLTTCYTESGSPSSIRILAWSPVRKT